MSAADRRSSVSFFDLQRQCPVSASAQRDTQRLVQYGHDRRLQNLVPGPGVPAQDRARVYRQCKRSLEAGFHVLLLGLGSKYDLVQGLARLVLGRYVTVTVNGYSNLFSIRYLLTTIAERVLNVHLRHRHHLDLLAQDLVHEFQDRASTHMYLVVHSLDGPRFRNAKVQNVFSRLGRCPYIHIIATVDHLRTRLLWDSAAVSSLSFHTVQVHTLQSYLIESRNPTLNKRRRRRANAEPDGEAIRTQSSSIDSILKCLTSRQREALSYLAYSQVHCNQSGIGFQQWMDDCMCPSDRDFRKLVDELKFHKIVEMVEDQDTAAVYYKIPYSNEVIEQKLLLDPDPDY